MTGLSVSNDMSRMTAFCSASSPMLRALCPDARVSARMSSTGRARQRLLVVGLGRTLGAVTRALHRLQVGQRQLGIDGLDVSQGIDPAGHVHHIPVLETAHHVRDGIHLAYVRQELVAQPLALRGAGNQPGDIDELDGGRNDLLRPGNIAQLLQPRIRHRHHAHIGVDGTEGEIGRGDTGLGQRVEQSGFANIGQTDDSAFDAHGRMELLIPSDSGPA